LFAAGTTLDVHECAFKGYGDDPASQKSQPFGGKKKQVQSRQRGF
jgi:hypothetical protein